MPETEEFYEDDEPLEDIVAAWERGAGAGGTTAPPFWTINVSTQSVATGEPLCSLPALGSLVTDAPTNRGVLARSA
jgi:hypothetical protein